MANRNDDEKKLFGVVKAALDRFINAARDKVMAPFRSWKGMPDPVGVYQAQDQWSTDTILTTIGQIAMGAWSEATDVPPVSRHAFVVAQLAETQNFLVRIPDEVYNLVFAEITDAVNNGGSVPDVATAVDGVLATTNSERWANRARVIAITETTRAYGAGTTAAGLEQSRITGRLLQKTWRTEHDDRVRASHRALDGVTIPLYQPFNVGGFPMLFPGDPQGPPDEVINCRCDVAIVNEGGR
jgi:Phage Mu protein F like protein